MCKIVKPILMMMSATLKLGKVILKTLEEVFSRFQDANLTLNLAKCNCCHATYLGKEVSHGTVRPVKAKVCGIIDFPSPKFKK